jgi:hypothetical protein
VREYFVVMISLVSVNAHRTEREVQKMPLLFYSPLIIWMGLFEVAQDEMRVPVKIKALRETRR